MEIPKPKAAINKNKTLVSTQITKTDKQSDLPKIMPISIIHDFQL
tara:strand:- start:190 stop:324 length:135 start_codon:yes stop_codon:yes gene_type:complete